MNYWEECISEAFDDANVGASKEQIETVADWIKGAHENYGMAYGHDAVPDPLLEENKKIKKELEDEKNKIICEECNGTGNEVTHGASFTATSSCWRCRGEGKYLNE